MNGVIASTVQTLQITIGDVNDNGPEFYQCEGDTCTKKNSFTGNVDEHSSVGVAVADLKIRVKDPDQVGSNNRDSFEKILYFNFLMMMVIIIYYNYMYDYYIYYYLTNMMFSDPG